MARPWLASLAKTEALGQRQTKNVVASQVRWDQDVSRPVSSTGRCGHTSKLGEEAMAKEERNAKDEIRTLRVVR